MTMTVGDLPLSRTKNVGSIRIHAIEAGLQWLDGGAMFGVVPKPLWERRIACDERNRIPLALRCLLVEAPNALVLIDTGIGCKESAKFMDLYGVENSGEPTRLEDGILMPASSRKTSTSCSTPISTSITRAGTRSWTATAL